MALADIFQLIIMNTLLSLMFSYYAQSSVFELNSRTIPAILNGVIDPLNNCYIL